MQTIRELVMSGFRGYWFEAVMTILLLVISFLLGRWRARKQWQSRSFDELLNVSLNTVIDGTLYIRTVMEASLKDVFINPIAIEAVSKAAKHTKVGQALLPLPADQAWSILNLVLNEVSERFATGFLRRDAGLPVTTIQFVLCLTCERDAEVRTQKVRAMLIRKDTLLLLPDEPPQFEAASHAVRWKTLHEMKLAYCEQSHLVRELELCF